jgi:AcrR family transcriptional regulator
MDAPTEPIPTSQRLESEAARLFWEHGYAATTTRELAQALGINKASLYYHIASKEDLLHRVSVASLKHIHGSVKKATEGVEDPLERVRALIRGHLYSMLEDKYMHSTTLTELRSLSPENRSEVTGMRDDYEEFVRSILSEAQQAGALRSDVSVEFLSLSLLGLMNWSIFWFRPDGPLGLHQVADLFVTLFIDGARVKGAPKVSAGAAELVP